MQDKNQTTIDYRAMVAADIEHVPLQCQGSTTALQVQMRGYG